MCLAGIRETVAREFPFFVMPPNDPYRGYWFGYTGLSLRSFLHDPPALQAIKRCFNYPVFLLSRLWRHASAPIFGYPEQRAYLSNFAARVRRAAERASNLPTNSCRNGTLP
jgi:hypothetical protein